MSVCKYKKLSAFIFIFMWFQLVVLTHLRRKTQVIIMRKERKKLLFNLPKKIMSLKCWQKSWNSSIETNKIFTKKWSDDFFFLETGNQEKTTLLWIEIEMDNYYCNYLGIHWTWFFVCGWMFTSKTLNLFSVQMISLPPIWTQWDAFCCNFERCVSFSRSSYSHFFMGVVCLISSGWFLRGYFCPKHTPLSRPYHHHVLTLYVSNGTTRFGRKCGVESNANRQCVQESGERA